MSDIYPTSLSPFNHFFMEYGKLLGAWGAFEVVIEVALMRELRLTPEEACITFASVGSGARFNILYALFNRRPSDKSKISLITEAVELAERNGLVHGFISANHSSDVFTFVRRDVKRELIVKPKIMTALQAQRHLHIFSNKVQEVQDRLAISDEDLIRYQRFVESLAKIPQAPPPAKVRPAVSFREAKQALRRERRAALALARQRES